MSALLRNIPIAVTVALAMVFAACGGGGESGQVITDEQMTKMVLALHQFGTDVRGFGADPANGAQTIDSISNTEFDPAEERGDLERSGFEASYDEVFRGDAGLSGGVLLVRSGVMRFLNDDGANGYFEDQQYDLGTYPGRTSPHGYVVNEVTHFELPMENSAGVHIVSTQADGSQTHETQAMFRNGRLVGYVTVAGVGGGDFDRATFEGRVANLMAVMDQQVQFVLAGNEAANKDDLPLYVSNATDALGKSAEQFEDKVDSVSGDFTMQLTGDSFNAGMNGDFAFSSAEEAMYMRFAITGSGTDESNPGLTLNFDGLEVQFIYRDGTFYMLTPFTGWVYGEPDDLDINSDEIEDLLKGGGPIDYAGMLDDLGDIEDLGIEQTDAGPMRHYRMEMDVAEVIEAIGGVPAEEAIPADDMSGAITMDIWLDSENLLPHRFEANGQITSGGDAVTIAMQMNFRGYGEAVVIPGPPADAVPIEDAFGDADFNFEGEVQQAEVERAVEQAFSQ